MKMMYSLTGLLFFTFLLISSIPMYAYTGENDDEEIVIEDLKTEADFETALETLSMKVDQLKAEKKIITSKSERKALRNEIKEVKREILAVKEAAKKISGGVYLGTGALLAIILILLLI